MPLAPLRDRHFSLSALAAEVGSLCARMRSQPADERVSSAPDERTLRYYQSLGVLDRPLRYDGRQAVYGYRHLLQALAARALQAEGLSLAQVQRALAGAGEDVLESAVLEALGEAAPLPTTPPAPPAPPAPLAERPRAPPGIWSTFTLAPGVLLTVDPQLHPDPESLVRLVTAALAPTLTGDPS